MFLGHLPTTNQLKIGTYKIKVGKINQEEKPTRTSSEQQGKFPVNLS